VLGTQTVATLIAVYGLFMTPLGWGWALFVWGYALAWFLVNDRVKLLAYWILDPLKASPKPETKGMPHPQADAVRKPGDDVMPKPEAKAGPKPKAEVKPAALAAPRPDGKTASQPLSKAEPKPRAKAGTPSDLTPKLVKRVHELYEELGRADVQAVQDWEKAEQKMREDEPQK
jgi:H+-transporting ATPase